MKNILSILIIAVMLLFIVSCKQDSKPTPTPTQTVAPPNSNSDGTKRKYPALNKKANAIQKPVMLNQSEASKSKMKAMKKLRGDTNTIKKNR